MWRHGEAADCWYVQCPRLCFCPEGVSGWTSWACFNGQTLQFTLPAERFVQEVSYLNDNHANQSAFSLLTKSQFSEIRKWLLNHNTCIYDVKNFCKLCLQNVPNPILYVPDWKLMRCILLQMFLEQSIMNILSLVLNNDIFLSCSNVYILYHQHF